MGAVGGSLAGEACKTFNIASGSSSSSNSSNDVHREGEEKQIDVEKYDQYCLIASVESVEVPATNSGLNNTFLNIGGKLLTGSKFVHEGLIIYAGLHKTYVCQTYPIQLKKCKDRDDAINKIKKCWQINKDAKNENLKTTVYFSEQDFCLSCVKEEVEKLPNEYDLFNYNCQHFCSKIIKKFRLRRYKGNMFCISNAGFGCPNPNHNIFNK